MDILLKSTGVLRVAASMAAVAVIGGCALGGTREIVPVELSGHYAVPQEVRTAATAKATIEVTQDRYVFGRVDVKNIDPSGVELGEGAIGSSGSPIASLVKISDSHWLIPEGTRLTPAQYEGFMAGNLYVNVRSSAHPEGEIRGQITPAACRFAAVEQVEVTPAPPPPQKLTLAADALFDFDKATLRDKGKEKLDGLVDTLQGTSYHVIHITGYTDRIGDAAYNQSLSERRAKAVASYLASKGIPAKLLDAKGRGERDPVTQPGDCKGKHGADLISCLQPDRRVEVEVTYSDEQQ